jgi:hypothetical protein
MSSYIQHLGCQIVIAVGNHTLSSLQALEHLSVGCEEFLKTFNDRTKLNLLEDAFVN